MIELVSVEVTNFRSFGTATFAPLGIGQGLTTITGNNGAGKSSIATTALLWALYGLTPDGVPVKALRRQGSDGEVRVTATFRHNSQTITVSRALRGKNDTTVAAISVDGVEQTSVSAKTATAWVTNRFGGLDAAGFLTAFVVRQKELDSLVRAKPAERRATIERLAGIERMAAAVDTARADARTAAKLLDALPAPSMTVEAAAAAIVDAKQRAADATDALADAEQQARDAEQAAQAARAAASTARTALDELAKASHAMSLAATNEKVAANEVERLTAAAQDADLLADAQAAAENAAEERAQADQAIRALAGVTARAERELARATQLQQAADDARTKHEQAQAAVARHQQTLDALAEEALDSEAGRAARATAAEQARLAAEALGAARGEHERLARAIEMLQSHGHGPHCPTCGTQVSDLDGLLAGLQNDLAAAAHRITTCQQDATATAERHETLLRAAKQAAQLYAQMSTLESKAESAAQTYKQAQADADAAHEAAETAAEDAEHAVQAADAAKAQLPKLREAEQAAQAFLRRVETAADAAAQLPEATAKHEAAITVLVDAEERMRIASKAADGVDMATLEQAAQDANEVSRRAEGLAAQARSAQSLAERDVTSAEAEAARVEQAVNARAAARVAAEQAAAVAAALEEFRRDRLARLAPELSEVASDLVAQMTDGAFTAVELDELFTPVITTANGEQRPASWLSGGEESTVALALRIAIGEVIAGQRGGLLVLDEVLTAQDRPRRAATVAAIRALPRQVVMINHVAEATDMADLVLTVVEGEDGASVDAAAGSGGDAPVSDLAIDA